MKRLICFLIGHKLVWLTKTRESIDFSSAIYIYPDTIDCIFCKRCGYKIYYE